MNRLNAILGLSIVLVAAVWLASSTLNSSVAEPQRKADSEPRSSAQAPEPTEAPELPGQMVEAMTNLTVRSSTDSPTENSAQNPKAASESAEATVNTFAFFGRAATPDGHSLPDVRVRTSFSPDHYTDFGGIVELRCPTRKEVWISLDAPGRILRTIKIDSEHQTIGTALEITLELEAVLRVSILNAPRGSLAIGCYSETGWLAASSPGEFSSVEHGVSDVNGRTELHEISNLPSRLPLSIELIRRTSYGEQSWVRLRRAELSLKPGQLSELEFDLSTGARVFGTLVDSKRNPIVGYEVQIRTNQYWYGALFKERQDWIQSTYTDSSGRFSFAGIEPGRWRVGPSPTRQEWQPNQGIELVPFSELVVVDQADGLYELTLVGHEGLSIRGILIDPDGSPIQGGGVSSVSEEARILVSTWSNEDGVFELGPLIPGGYEVFASRDGFHYAKPIIVEAGSSDVVLQLRRGRILKGEVRDIVTGERRRADVRISSPIDGARSHGGGLVDNLRGASANYGTFEIQGLGPGRHYLCATSPDGRVGTVSVNIEEEDEARDIVITLDEGANLQIRNEIQCESAVVKVWLGEHYVGRDWMSSKQEDLISVPPGDLRVVLEASGNVYEQEVHLSRGETKIVLFRED